MVPAKEASKSPLSSGPVVTPDESTHHAEQARVIIQSELDGNERMNRERQAILKSALEFVNSMARGANWGLMRLRPSMYRMANAQIFPNLLSQAQSYCTCF